MHDINFIAKIHLAPRCVKGRKKKKRIRINGNLVIRHVWKNFITNTFRKENEINIFIN